MAAIARVGGGDDIRTVRPPGFDDAIDRLRVQVRSVGEHDDRGLDVRAERGKPAAKRRARAAFPVGAVDDARVSRYRVCTGHDDNVVHGAGGAHAGEHTGQQERLLRRPEAGRSAGGEDDGGDHGVQRIA